MSKIINTAGLMKAVLCCSILIVHFSISLAQNKRIDSLLVVIKTEKEDTNKVINLNALSEALYKTSKYDTALVCSNSTRELAEKLGFKRGVMMGLSSAGVVYDYFGKYPLALQNEFKSLSIATEMNDKIGIAHNLSNIGELYGEQADYSKALDYILKAIATDEEIHDSASMSGDLGNIGIIYDLQGNRAKSLEYGLKALAIDRATGNKDGIAAELGNIAILYKEMGNYPKAVEYDEQGLSIERELGDQFGIATKLGDIGSVYTNEKEFKVAKAYLDSSLGIAKTISGKDLINRSYSNLAVLDSAKGDYKSALGNFKMAIVYHDSMMNEENTKKTVQAEMNYEFEQKQAKAKAEQDKKDVIATQERKKQTIIRNAFMGGFILMLALAFFIFRGYKQKQKANEIISSQKAVVEEKQKEILDSIHYAQRIQKALLASDTLLTKNLPEYFVLYKPKDIVSGDFYWATIKDDRFYLAVCDSTGHGVPGAFMSLLNISFLNEAIVEKNITEPNKVFNHVRRKLIENVSQDGGQDGMDGVLVNLPIKDKNYGQMIYSVAYNAPIIIRDNTIIELNGDKMPIGASPKENESFINREFKLQKEDMVYAFTDGYADQFGGPKGKKYKYKQLQEKLLAISHQPLAEQKEVLEQTFEEWKGNLEQVDDVLLIGVKI